MKRRTRWMAVIGLATLGLAIAGQGGTRGFTHAAAPDDPQGLPALQLMPNQPPPASRQVSQDDPFAPFAVEQFLPASSQAPRTAVNVAPESRTMNSAATPVYSGAMAPVGFTAPPASMGASIGARVPPAPIATMAPMAAPGSQLAGEAHHWDMKGAAGDTCPTCGHCGSGGLYTSMIDNMVIFAGADYFSNAGGLDNIKLRSAADELGHLLLGKAPDLDPNRLGSILSINVGVPFTPDGDICFQIGGTYIEEEEGAQGFLTTGFYHRCHPGEGCGVNWGMVYDYKYDDFIDYAIGQLRFKAGYSLTTRDEIGGWFTLGTNVEKVDLIVTSLIIGTGGPIFQDNIRARVAPMGQGYFFWHHVFNCGADSTIFTGARGSLGGSFVIGSTAQLPINDCWAIAGGGHWSHDSDDDGSWDAYLGVAFYPGGNAPVRDVCGNRFLPYQDVANNTFMPTRISPMYLQINPVGLPPVRARL